MRLAGSFIGGSLCCLQYYGVPRGLEECLYQVPSCSLGHGVRCICITYEGLGTVYVCTQRVWLELDQA
jgi:hypothetical protein